MKRTKEQKTADRERFRRLSFRQKAEHIWLYYKWPILLGLATLVILGTTAHRLLHRKDTALYLAMVNVTMNESLTEAAGTGWLRAEGLDPDRTQTLIYEGLVLSQEAQGDAHRAAYASRIKLMAAVESRQLDAVYMSRQSYDILSAQGYLLPIPELCAGDPALLAALEPILAENRVIREDNELDYLLDEARQRQTVTETAANALTVEELPPFAGNFPEPVYLGFLANTPRPEACRSYLRYLLGP